jgi:serine/threonine protein phosphatase PrpC
VRTSEFVTSFARDDHGSGEDAPPVCVEVPGRGVILAVFDGLGGSGSSRLMFEGEQRTSAWVGSRVAAAYVAEQASAIVDRSREEIVGILEPALRAELKARGDELASGEVQSRLVSKAIKRLPTTMALCAVRPTMSDDGGDEIVSVWAGDSRCYVLTPVEGLRVLTTDHTSSTKSTSTGRSDDGAMNNVLSASGDFHLQAATTTVQGPAIVLTGTDGAYDYVQSPEDLEYLILSALAKSTSIDEWGRTLADALVARAGDDVSIALCVRGVDDLHSARGAFASRLDDLVGRGESLSAIRRRLAGTRQELARLEEELNAAEGARWETYRDGHFSLIATDRQEP